MFSFQVHPSSYSSFRGIKTEKSAQTFRVVYETAYTTLGRRDLSFQPRIDGRYFTAGKTIRVFQLRDGDCKGGLLTDMNARQRRYIPEREPFASTGTRREDKAAGY